MLYGDGDLWDRLGGENKAQVICITTNGATRGDGRGVMGAGVAAQAQARFPHLEAQLGRHLQSKGNVTATLLCVLDGVCLVAFPTKHAYYDERADLELIARSARGLVELAAKCRWTKVVLPPPGCGNGKLEWAEVEPVIAPILDDRFTVVGAPRPLAPGEKPGLIDW